MPQPRSEFSFSIYGQLTDDLDAAYERYVAEQAEAERARAQIEAEARRETRSGAIAQVLNEQGRSLSAEARAWMTDELLVGMEAWERHVSALGGEDAPLSVDQILQMPNLVGSLSRLYDARQAIADEGVLDHAGSPLADDMHLVFIPWQTFRQHCDSDLVNWVAREHARAQGSDGDGQADIANALLHAVERGEPVYRLWSTPGTPTVSARDYLDARIRQDGPWGAMLVQTTIQPGVTGLDERSADDLTEEGQHGVLLAGHEAANLGYVEWLALTLQNGLGDVSPNNYSLLLAHRINLPNSTAQLFSARTDHHQGLMSATIINEEATYDGNDIGVRPAVFAHPALIQ